MKSEKEYRESLRQALIAGWSVLERGESSVSAVETAIQVLENAPCFTAGKGAVISHSEICELDASIMDGKTKLAGCVAGVTVAKNPISVARAVMERSPYVMIIGCGADNFAREMKLEIVDSSYFITEEQWRLFQEAKQAKETAGHLGTVGAVALDRQGNIAAAHLPAACATSYTVESEIQQSLAPVLMPTIIHVRCLAPGKEKFLFGR